MKCDIKYLKRAGDRNLDPQLILPSACKVEDQVFCNVSHAKNVPKESSMWGKDTLDCVEGYQNYAKPREGMQTQISRPNDFLKTASTRLNNGQVHEAQMNRMQSECVYHDIGFKEDRNSQSTRYNGKYCK